MIIQLRGLSGSGKSTIVRNVLAQYIKRTPILGALGLAKPEAYRCERKDRPPLYILGPYNISHEGVDWLTKKMSFAQFIDFLSHYAAKGDVLFESLRFSTRWAEPTLGKWLTENKDRCILAILQVPFDDICLSIAKRQHELGHPVKQQKHAVVEIRLFESATLYAEKAGMRIENVNRDNAVRKILGWLV